MTERSIVGPTVAWRGATRLIDSVDTSSPTSTSKVNSFFPLLSAVNTHGVSKESSSSHPISQREKASRHCTLHKLDFDVHKLIRHCQVSMSDRYMLKKTARRRPSTGVRCCRTAMVPLFTGPRYIRVSSQHERGVGQEERVWRPFGKRLIVSNACMYSREVSPRTMKEGGSADETPKACWSVSGAREKRRLDIWTDGVGWRLVARKRQPRQFGPNSRYLQRFHE